MEIIKTASQHKRALGEIETLMNNSEPNTPQGDRLELLIQLTTDYEDRLAE